MMCLLFFDDVRYEKYASATAISIRRNKFFNAIDLHEQEFSGKAE